MNYFDVLFAKKQSGGGAPTLISKTITANGTYTASDDNADGYSQVTVAVDGFKKKYIANTPTDIASFNDGTANPMPSLEISIEPQQDLHGYDYPWGGGAGKNKFDIANTADTAEDNNGNQSTSYGIKTGDTLNWQTGFYSRSVWFSVPQINFTQNTNITISADVLLPSKEDLTNNILVFRLRKGLDDTTKIEKQVATTIGTKTRISVTLSAVANVNYDKLAIQPIGNKNAATNLNCQVSNIQIEIGSSATTFEPYSNICPISGHTEADVTVTDDLTTPTETHTLSIPFHDNSDNPITVYGGTLNVTSGELTATHANIASYNGETINEPWISSMDTYSAGATPTTGAQVVYPLATPQTYQLTPAQVTTLLGQNNIFADCGQILEGEYFVTL